MESQFRNNGGLDGVHTSGERGGKNEGFKWSEVLLRVLALILTLVAAILLGIDKQTKTVPLKISDDLPVFNVPATAKSSYLSAFVYFVVVNSIACAFAAISLVSAFASKGGDNVGSLLTTILIDLIMMALLFSSVGAAGAVGLIGFNGNSHLRWTKVCNVYARFCHQAMAAIALSLLAAVVYLLLTIIAVLKVLKRA